MKRILALTLIAAALMGGLIFSPVTAQEEHPWQFREVSGNRIAWSCTGTGQPTFILIAGGGLSAHDSFGRIYHNYSGPGRVCMYDRAGLDKSSFTNPKTRTLDQLVEELRDLSRNEAWGNAVLVPHSFGGFIARAYADKYPKEVRAILFLDVAHEDWVPRLKAEMKTADWAIMERILAWNTKTFHEDYEQAQEAVRPTRLRENLPITVLSRGVPNTKVRLERMTDEGIDLFEGEHKILQTKIAALTKNSEHRTARYSSHVFNDYDPWIVIEEMGRLSKRLPQ